MKILKRILSVVLVLCVVFSASAPCFAAASTVNLFERYKAKAESLSKESEQSLKETINYVSLGASQSLGDGLIGLMPEKCRAWEGTKAQFDEWNEYGWNGSVWNPDEFFNMPPLTGLNTYNLFTIVDGSFSSLIKEEIESQGYDVNLSQLAFRGMRTNDLCWFLLDDFDPDFYNLYHHVGENRLLTMLTGLPGTEGLSYFQNLYRTAVMEADFITYDLGSNNFSCQILTWLDNGSELDFESILGKEEYKKFESAKNLIKNSIDDYFKDDEEILTTLESLTGFVDILSYAYLGYCSTFDKAMEWIFENNPDVTVCVLQIQNLFTDFNLSINNVILPIGNVLDIITDLANVYASSLSPYCEKYYYAKLTDSSRVECNLDDIRAYEGLEDITDYLREVFSINDAPLGLRTRLTQKYEALGLTLHDDTYEKALDYSYDTVIKFIKYIDSNYIWTPDLFAFDDDALDLIKAEYGDLIVSSVLGYCLEGEDPEQAYNDVIAYLKNASLAVKSALAYAVYASIGGPAELAHPNYDGAKQMADAVTETISKGIKGTPVAIAGIVDTARRLEETTKNIVETVSESLPETMAQSSATTILQTTAAVPAGIVSKITAVKLTTGPLGKSYRNCTFVKMLTAL